jgi:DNA-binding XRE family transcriptional regulator
MIELQQMLSAISAAGYSQARMAAELDVSQPTVNRIIKGTQSPSYETGKKIEALFKSLVPPSPDSGSIVNVSLN